MSDHMDSMSAEEKRASEAIRSLPAARADETFRARLRQDFVSGTWDARRPPRSRPRSTNRLTHIAVAAAIAAAIIATIVVMNRGPRWEILGTNVRGEIVIDGHAVPTTETETLARRLTSGALVRLSEEAEMEILCDGHLVILLTPSTEMSVPKPPGRWWGRGVRSSFHAGEARILTGPRFRGARLSIDTEEASIAVTGTTLAVIRESEATCVCAFEGSVAVGPKGGALEAVPPGLRKFHYKDGRLPLLVPIDDMENTKLGMFQDQNRPKLEGSQ